MVDVQQKCPSPCDRQVHGHLDCLNGPHPPSYSGILESLIGILIVSHQILIDCLWTEQQQQTLLLLIVEFTSFQEQFQLIKKTEPFISRTYEVLPNQHVHYIEVSQKFPNIKVNLQDLQHERQATVYVEQIHQFNNYITMEKTNIMELQQKERKWFKED